MSIQGIRKCGFLVEDGVSWGEIIGILRYDVRTPQALRLAEQMNSIRAQDYYEPIQPMLITEEIEEIPAISPVAPAKPVQPEYPHASDCSIWVGESCDCSTGKCLEPAKPVEFVHLGLEVKA